MSRVWPLVLSLLALFGSAAPARAEASLDPRLPVCIAPLHRADTPGGMLATSARFDCRRAQTAFGPGDFWVRPAQLPARLGAGEQVDVRFGSLWQRNATLWARYADGAVMEVPLDGRALSRHMHVGETISVRLPRRGAPIIGLLWRVEGSANLRGVLIGAALASPAQTSLAELRMGAIYAGFAGLCLALLIHNLALWGAMRHRFQLAYCLLIVSLLGYAASKSGLLGQVWPDLANNDRMRLDYLTLALTASTALSFLRGFFEPRIFTGRLNRATTVVIASQLLLTMVLISLAPVGLQVLDRLYAASFLLVLGIVAVVLWRAWRWRSAYRLVFSIAWGTPMAMTLLRVACGLNLIAWRQWIDNSTIVSMTVEALLSSLAVAYRIRLLSRERDKAREGEHHALLLADTDPLTGLLNRRAFLRDAIGRMGEQSLILADVDHFKTVNEMLGHDGGDEVLRLIARALRSAAPSGALVARIGGEEFAVLGTYDAHVFADTLLGRVRAEQMPFDLSVTVSLGSCTGPLGDEADWKMLYRCADRALFDAKADGRDRARAAENLAQAA